MGNLGDKESCTYLKPSYQVLICIDLKSTVRKEPACSEIKRHKTSTLHQREVVKGFLGQLKGAFPLISLWEGKCGWVGRVLEESGLSECKLINGSRDKVGHLSQIGTWFFVLGAEECTGRQWNLVTQRALNRKDTVAGLSEFVTWVSLIDSETQFTYVLHSGNELHA